MYISGCSVSTWVSGTFSTVNTKVHDIFVRWKCLYCDKSNPDSAEFCCLCGAPRK